jgi:hypothetical protein
MATASSPTRAIRRLVRRRRAAARERIVRWHQAKEDVPANGVAIDGTAPIERVVDEILRRCK